MSTQEQALAHVNRTWEWFYAMVALSATNLGIELGLFETLRSKGPLKPDELARVHGLQHRPVDVWAKTLVHHGQLVAAGHGRVALSPGFEVVVCEPRTLLNLSPSIRYHARFLAQDFLELDAFFVDGLPRPPARHGPELSGNIAEQTAAMHAVFMQGMLPDLADVRARLNAGASVLDIGCGNGDLGLRLCLEFPGVTYQGFELDEHAVAAGRRIFEQAGITGRASLELEDFSRANVVPASFDVAFLFLALHEIPPASRDAVARAIRAALRPDGLLVVVDETYPESVDDAAMPAARMGVHFAYTELLWGSVVPTRVELTRLLEDSGFAVEWRPVLQASVEVVLARPA